MASLTLAFCILRTFSHSLSFLVSSEHLHVCLHRNADTAHNKHSTYNYYRLCWLHQYIPFPLQILSWQLHYDVIIMGYWQACSCVLLAHIHVIIITSQLLQCTLIKYTSTPHCWNSTNYLHWFIPPHQLSLPRYIHTYLEANTMSKPQTRLIPLTRWFICSVSNRWRVKHCP